jgi:hypothetical protein
VTLDDVSCLLYLPNQGTLLDRNGSFPKSDAVDLMVDLLGADVIGA